MIIHSSDGIYSDTIDRLNLEVKLQDVSKV